MSVAKYVDPVSMGSADVAIRNEDEDAGYTNKCLDISEFSVAATNRELVNLENAAVNIDNSNDVIIGPVTQFNVNGNVTIYQNKDGLPIGIEQKDEEIGNDCNANFKENSCKETVKTVLNYLEAFYHRRKRDLGRVCISILLSSCAILLYVTIAIHKDLHFDSEPRYGRHLGNATIYYASDWDGKTITNIIDNPLPVGLVVVSHTATETCYNFKKCAEIMKLLQTFQMTSIGYTDVCDNLYIGGDGNIYVGRGWDARNCYVDKLSISISFIGNFNSDYLTKSMRTSFELLLQQGIDLDKLPEKYLMVGHNQTEISDSPGCNVYKYIKTLPNFSAVDLRQKYDKVCFIYEGLWGKRKNRRTL